MYGESERRDGEMEKERYMKEGRDGERGKGKDGGMEKGRAEM